MDDESTSLVENDKKVEGWERVVPSWGGIVARKRTFGILTVVALTFFNVSGGAFGGEEIVSSVGPLIGIASIVLYSLFVSFPIVLVTAELSSAFPNDGGYSIWVTEAFGEFWGIQESYWSLASGVIDNAVYPVLIVDSLKLVFPTLSQASWIHLYSLKIGLACLFTIPNVVSLKSVGRILQFMCVVVVVPYVWMIWDGVGHLDFHRLTEVRTEPNWRQLLTVLFWNLNGYDCISTCAGEIREPQKTIPKGLFISICVVVLSYVLPLTVAVAWTGGMDKSSTMSSAGALGDDQDRMWKHWTDGSLSSIAGQIGGVNLTVAFVVCSIASNSGMYFAEMIEDSYQLYGMGKANLAPSCFGTLHATFKTPFRAIIFLLLIISCLVALDFSSLLILDNFFSCASLLLEMAASIQLRRILPDSDLPRPYKIPIGTVGLVCILSPFFAIGTLVLLNELTKSHLHFIVNVGGLIVGLVVSAIHTKNRGKGYKTPRRRAGTGMGEYARLNARGMSELNLDAG